MIPIALTDMIHIVAAVAVFGLVLAFWIAGIVLWRVHRSKRAKRFQERFGLSEEGPSRVLRLWHEGKEETLAVPGLPQRLGLIRRFEALCKDAGWSVPPSVLIPALGGAAILVFMLLLVVSGHLLAGACGAVATLALFWAYLKRSIGQRIALFDVQLVEALELASRSLRAGHPLSGSFHLVSEEIEDPVGSLFGEVCQQQEMGITLEQALRDVAAKCSSEDIKLFATCVAMQMRSGGNLADVMERLSQVIRDRMRLNRRVRVLTAQTQFSKRVLVALPLVLFALLNVMNPKYVAPLYDTTTGQIMLAAAGVSILMGMWMMNRMIVLDY